MSDDNTTVVWVFGVLMVTIVAAGGAWGCPQYRVYSRTMTGQAALREAEFDRQIRAREAEAELEAAGFLRLAEVERARGVAEANAIIGESLMDNEAYLRYLWIQGLHDGSSEVVYVPTEASLPILEAGRGAPRFNSTPQQ